MKKNIFRSIKIWGIIILFGGSFFISCSTAPEVNKDTLVSLNTGRNSTGKIYTTWVFSDIRKVIVTNSVDQSEKTELGPLDWKYNPATTELTLLRNLNFNDYIVSIEGAVLIPNKFIFNDIDKENDNDFLVIIDNRIAIEGFDYNFNKETKSIIFRNDLNLKDRDWFISYYTPEGMSSIGDWKGENMDQIAYFEAEQRKRYLDSLYDSRESFWFLEKSTEAGNPEEKPVLVKRKAASEELERMKSFPVSVIKYRGNVKKTELEKELGFDFSLPEIIYTENPSKKYRIFNKTIEEYSLSGILNKKLHVSYEDDTAGPSTGSVINITISSASSDTGISEKTEWLISEKELDLGVCVKKTEMWAIQTSGIDHKPEIVKLCSWNWSDNSAEYFIEAENSEEEISESFIREVINAGKTGQN